MQTSETMHSTGVEAPETDHTDTLRHTRCQRERAHGKNKSHEKPLRQLIDADRLFERIGLAHLVGHAKRAEHRGERQKRHEDNRNISRSSFHREINEEGKERCAADGDARLRAAQTACHQANAQTNECRPKARSHHGDVASETPNIMTCRDDERGRGSDDGHDDRQRAVRNALVEKRIKRTRQKQTCGKGDAREHIVAQEACHSVVRPRK